MSKEEKDLRQDADWPYAKDIPLILTAITEETRVSDFELANYEWLWKDIMPPKSSVMRVVTFDFRTEESEVAFDGINSFGLPNPADALALAFERLWANEINAVNILGMPTLTLLSFCGEIPAVGGGLQWEYKDLERIVEHVRHHLIKDLH